MERNNSSQKPNVDQILVPWNTLVKVVQVFKLDLFWIIKQLKLID